MREINCYIPIKLRITGRLSDTQLDALGETLVRALAARISFAQRIIASHSGHWRRGGVELVRELVREERDPLREDVAASEYSLPSYDRKGKRTKVPVKKQPARKEPQEQPPLVTFDDLAIVYEHILTFYPHPKPQGSILFGVYGIWARDSTPYVFFVSEIVKEGASRGQPWISAIPLVHGKLENGQFVPAGAGNVPSAVTLNEHCELRVLLSPQTRKGKIFNAILRRQSGRMTPTFLAADSHSKWRGKVIRFGVASPFVGEVTITAPAPAPEPTTPSAPPRKPPWESWHGANSLPAEPEGGEPEWLWRWYGWFNVRPADVRKNPQVKAVFAEWEQSGKWQDFISEPFLLFHVWYPRFYQEFCQKVALDMLATSRKNMSEFLAWLAQNETAWKTEFATRVQALREPAAKLHPITSRRAELEARKELLIRGEGWRELLEVEESLRQLEATSGAEAKELSVALQSGLAPEPLLALLTIQEGKTVRTLEGALVWASQQDAEQLLQHVRREMQWLIAKNAEAQREIENDADIAYKLKFVQSAANSQLAGWLQADRVFRESIERLVSGPGLLGWIGMGVGLLVLTFLFPPVGMFLGAAMSVPLAYGSVQRAMQLSRISGTRIMQYGFQPLASEEEIDAAMWEAAINVFFSLLDVGRLGSAGIARVEKAAAREAASALGLQLETGVLGWRRLDLWPAELTASLRRQVVDQLDQARPYWTLGMTAEQSQRYADDLVQAVQRELMVRYERRFLEFQIKFQRALEAGEVEVKDIQSIHTWLRREFPRPEEFFGDVARRELSPGSSLYNNTIGRTLAGQSPLVTPEAAEFLEGVTQAQLEALARELGPMAELLTPHRLYALGRSVGADYLSLSRRLHVLLGRVEGPEQVLAKLDDLLVGRENAEHILSALEGTANPRPILEALTPELLNFQSQLRGGTRELFEAISRPSRHGEVIRLLTVVDEQGVQGLLREVRRADGRSFFERWDGLTHGWQTEERLRPTEPQPSAGAVTGRAAGAVARFRLKSPEVYIEPAGSHPVIILEAEGRPNSVYRRSQAQEGGAARPGEPGGGEWAEHFGFAKAVKLGELATALKRDGIKLVDLLGYSSEQLELALSRAKTHIRETHVWIIKPATRAGDPGQEALNAEARQWVADEVAQGRINISRAKREGNIKKLNTWLRQNGVNVGGPYKSWDAVPAAGDSGKLTLLDRLKTFEYLLKDPKVDMTEHFYGEHYDFIVEVP